MKHLKITASIGILAGAISLCGADLPRRETMEKDGWTIEFSPIDRASAGQLAAQAGQLEQIRAVVGTAKIELEASVIEARARELAEKLAGLCGLPKRAGEFQKEIARMQPVVAGLLVEFRNAASPRVISIWRKSELIQRIQAGEKLPGFSYDPATNLVNWTYGLNYSLKPDYTVAQHPEPLRAFPLTQDEEKKTEGDPVQALIQNYRTMSGAIGSTGSRMYGKLVVARGFYIVITNVLAAEVPSGESARWIQAGAAQWALRRLFVQALNPEQVESYLWYHEQQLQKAFKNEQRINLEEAAGELTENQQAAAHAVFRTIAEKHGNEAVTKLLAAFWKLKAEKRTSQAFAKLCEKQLKQPLSAYLPRGVVFEPVPEKTKK